MKHREIMCAACGGTVRSHRGPGRTMEYVRGAPKFPVPEDFDMPRCDTCGDEYVPPETEPELLLHLKRAFLDWQKGHVTQLVQRLQQEHGATKAQVAGVCGVTPSHLSHLMNGSMEDARASVTLLRLLECYASCSSEFRRHLVGSSLDLGSLRLYEVQSLWTGPGETRPSDTAGPKPHRVETWRRSANDSDALLENVVNGG